jgi:hypothetical protein
MRKHLAIFVLCLFLPALSFAKNVVVWDFTTRDGSKTETTASLTYEFEEALAQGGSYTVLERRSLPRLQAVIQNEKALRDIGLISSTGSQELKQLGVTVVVFGEMFDDVDSGDVSVTVTFQDLTGNKLLIKSVLMRRGLLRDATSRREKMASLGQAISGATATTGSESGKLLREQRNNFIFDVESCSLSDRTVLCRLLITNNGEDRKLFIVLNSKHGGWADKVYIAPNTQSSIYDDFNNTATPARVQISNVSANSSNNVVVGAMLISGRPAQATIQFEGLSSRATTITRLDISCVDGESKSMFVTTFRNVPLK